MIIVRRSQATGARHERELDVTHQQMAAFERGVMVQDAFPQLSAEDREYILSGITPEEWAILYPPEEEDEVDASGGDEDGEQ